jgi:hypothetical protein
MAEERLCLMTLFAGRADRQSLDKLNQLLEEGWRIAEIDPSLQRLEGAGNVKAFIMVLKKTGPDSQ